MADKQTGQQVTIKHNGVSQDSFKRMHDTVTAIRELIQKPGNNVLEELGLRLHECWQAVQTEHEKLRHRLGLAGEPQSQQGLLWRGPFCPACWDSAQQVMPMDKVDRPKETYKCTKCEQSYVADSKGVFSPLSTNVHVGMSRH